jgi:ZIP family zinc transporter
MLIAAAWGGIAASSLLLGSLLMYWLKPSRQTIGLIMAFGAGTLISAIAYDLVQDAASSGRPVALALGLALGALTFYIGDRWVDRLGGAQRKDASGAQAEGDPLGIFLGTLLDGIPESFILGTTLVSGGSISAAFVAAVFISNIPEAMAATTGLTKIGWSRRRIIGIWLAVVVVSAASAAFGYWLFTQRTLDGVLVQAFGAGALLTMLADTMMPEAFENGGKAVGLLTVLGFAVAFALDQLG